MKASVKIRVGLLGPSYANSEVQLIAEELGAGIAKRGAILICGGLGGVMEAATRGAKQHGGFTVGILPGTDDCDANSFIDLPIVSGMGEVRNILIVRSSHVVIALGGGHGTLSEIAFALKLSVPIVGINTWSIDSPDETEVPIAVAESPRDAVEKAFGMIRR